MPLETGSYISDLNATNPVTATDPVSEGADHLRLIKTTLLNTFPNVDDEIYVTPAELNLLDSIAARTGSGNLVLSNSPTFTGTITADIINAGAVAVSSLTGNLNASDITSGVLSNARVQESNVTQHESALTITEAQISDLQDYLTNTGDVANTLNIGGVDTTLTRINPGQLGVEGASVFTHNSTGYTSAKIFVSNGVEPTTQGANGDIFLVF